MDKDKLNKINEWIWRMEEEDDIQPSDTAFGKSFGFIQMIDGRKAQIKVTLELDEDEWDD